MVRYGYLYIVKKIEFYKYNFFKEMDKCKFDDIKIIVGKLQLFLDTLFDKLYNFGIDTDQYELDHVCYRVTTLDEYIVIKSKFKNISRLLIESPVQGRLISIWKLFEPIKYKDREIYLIELPMVKINSLYTSGWEHCEFVIDNFNDFQDKYSNIQFDTTGISKIINPDLRLELDNNPNYRINCKFHLQSIESVISLK